MTTHGNVFTTCPDAGWHPASLAGVDLLYRQGRPVRVRLPVDWAGGLPELAQCLREQYGVRTTYGDGGWWLESDQASVSAELASFGAVS